MARFLLLLRDQPSNFTQLSPGEMQGIIEEYQAWNQRIAKEGKLVLGEKLKDESGRRLSRQGERTVVTDGPYTELKDVVSGFYILHASSYDEAAKLASGCPHLQYGNVELREIQELSGK